VVYLLGYPSALSDLAERAGRLELGPPKISVIVSNAEPLLPEQRKIIEGFFGCDVRDTYGMAEMVAGAGECEYGTMHLWPEAGFVEVVDDDHRPVQRGETGRLVCTGLVNTKMPLIRYEVGDRGALARSGEKCRCGRNLPILTFIEGRLDDVVVAPDGRRIGRLDTAFKANMPIREVQVLQESPNDLLVRVVPDDGFESADADRIVDAVRDRVGEMRIRIERVATIPRGPNGKLRAVINLLPPLSG
jgi:phenylacetate-CoA ligase